MVYFRRYEERLIYRFRKTREAIYRDWETQAELKRITNEKLPLMAEENKLAAEIGPIKYIAELFYSKDDPSFIDKAVRTVIIIIIIVFDPLAILLLIAAQQTLRNTKLPEPEIKIRKAKKKKTLDTPSGPSLESFFTDDGMEHIPKNKITKIDGDLK